MFISNQKLNQAKQAFLLQFRSLIKTHWFYSLGLFSTLAVLHLGIVRSHPIEGEEISFYALYWAGILYLVWQNRQLENTTTLFSSGLGLGLLFMVISRPLYLWHLDTMLFRLGPIIAALGLGLLSFGFSGFKHYWRLFVLLCLMLSPYSFINEFFDLRLHFNELTATISAFLLHYLGIKAVYQGAFVTLPTGQVEVLYFCTGGPLIVWLLKLTLLIMVVVVPLNWRQRLGLVLSATGTGFLTGCIRVALLAVVVDKKSLFEYWHSYTGGSIFMAIATITFAALCNWILPFEQLNSTEKTDSVVADTINLKRVFLLATTWIGIVLTALYLIASKRVLNTAIFPDALNLNSWQQVAVKSVIEQKSDTQTTPNSKVMQFGKDYKYLKDDQQMELQMRYVVNTRGEPNPFLQQLSDNLVKDSQKNVRYIQGVGYYALYSDANQAYLTACINRRGGGTVTSAQFMQNRYAHDLTWSRILPWVLGKDVLRDNRCMWVQLSAPLNGVADTNIYPVLESIWTNNYAAWQSLFPTNQGV
ncbi:putative eight transmembrane protein EpsH [Cylindrospermum sp. NIES-4074]|nr:putative eight transmembrane protein EpsH [Cylindrospermum sp. NIES-4074]